MTLPIGSVATLRRKQGLGFSKRSDREVDGFGSTGMEAEPETIAVRSAFGAPPADAGGGMFVGRRRR